MNKFCQDHLGKTYTSQKEMCRAYGIGETTFSNRISKGWTIKQALTLKINEKRENKKI